MGESIDNAMDEKFLRNVLFPVIQAGLDKNVDGRSVSEEDCSLLMQIGLRQSILPVICRGLKRLGVSGEFLDKMKQQCNRDIYWFVVRDQALANIYNVLEEARIPYIPLKGSIIRNLYPEPWMRTSCDIDVLIHEEDLDRAVAALEEKTDFKFEKRLYHDISMLSPQVHLELHFTIKENMDNIDALLDKVWSYAHPKDDGYQWTMTPEYQIFHVVAHMCYHFVHGGLGIRPYLDLWLLRNKTTYDESTVRDMCQSCGILKFYETCCLLSEVWMNDQKHTETTAAMEQYCLEGGVFGTSKTAQVARQREHRGVSYIFHRLFLPKEILMELYPVLKEKPYLLPYYELKRWSAAFTSKRKSVQNELKMLRSTSRDSIDSFDKFLNRMEL